MSQEKQPTEEQTWGTAEQNPLGGSRPFDVITDVLIPACIFGMAVAFTFFLLEVRTALGGVGTGLLKYVCFFFLFAVILISRLRRKYGGTMVAAPYSVALALAVALAMAKFSAAGGAITPGMGFLGNLLILGAAWWIINKLTDECTVEEATADESGEGFLSSLSKDLHKQVPRPRKGSRKTEEAAQKALPKRRHPGRWVIYFAIGALVVFGLSQKVVAGGERGIAVAAFRCMVAYTFFALALLALTSLSGLRLYLKRRGLSLPRQLPPSWIAAAGIMVVAILLAAAAVPRVTSHTRQHVSAYTRLLRRSQQELETSAPVEGVRSPKGQASAPATEGEPAGRTGSKNEGGQSQRSTSREGTGGAEQSGKGAGEEQSGPGDAESKQQDGRGTEAGGRGEAEGQGEGRGAGKAEEHQQQSTTPSREETQDRTEGERRPGAEETKESRSERREAAEPPSQPETGQTPSGATSALSSLLKVLALIAAVLIGLWVLAQVLPALLRSVSKASFRLPNLSAWLANLASRLAAFRDGLSRWFKLPFGLFRAGPAAAPQKPKGNPFRDRRFLHTLSPAQAVEHAYQQLMAYAQLRGCPRPEHRTPYEFLRLLPTDLEPARQEIDYLTRLFVLASYTPHEVKPEQVELLAQTWERLFAEAQAFLAARSAKR